MKVTPAQLAAVEATLGTKVTPAVIAEGFQIYADYEAAVAHGPLTEPEALSLADQVVSLGETMGLTYADLHAVIAALAATLAPAAPATPPAQS